MGDQKSGWAIAHPAHLALTPLIDYVCVSVLIIVHIIDHEAAKLQGCA